MSKIKEIIVEAVLPVIKAVGKVEMKKVLLDIKEHNTPEIYRKTIRSLHANFSLLNEAALKTRSKIDDGLVDLVLTSVKDSADADGITLL